MVKAVLIQPVRGDEAQVMEHNEIAMSILWRSSCSHSGKAKRTRFGKQPSKSKNLEKERELLNKRGKIRGIGKQVDLNQVRRAMLRGEVIASKTFLMMESLAKPVL